MTSCAGPLRARLLSSAPSETTGLVVGLSGGADSAALLALLAGASRDLPLRAVHIDHGLQVAAAQFRTACSELCRRLEVPLTIHEVTVATDGMSLEAAARTARYAAFARELRRGECLLTAHHRDDQAETLLLQLMRGAGLKGLAAMPVCRELGSGWHLRPLLSVSRETLRQAALELGVSGIDDPMNRDVRFDRAYLRSHVVPLLEARWPAATTALTRTAAHLAAAQDLLEQLAAADWRRVRDGDALSLSALRSLGSAQQVNVLRHWLTLAGGEPPSTARLREALRQMLNARQDHLPTVVWGELAVRRYRDRMFVTAATLPELADSLPWGTDPASQLHLGVGLGILRWRPRRGGLDLARLPARIEVRRRLGGETLKPAPKARTQSLQHLCQVHGVLPWMRPALPLIYAGDQLIAVAGLWADARWCVAAPAMGMAIAWDEAPVLV